jgi:archaellum component FlaC
MEQIKETVTMIKPEEWADTHLEAHLKINSAITQFYWLLNDLISEINSFTDKQEDAEERSFASFSKLKEDISGLSKGIESLNKSIECINNRLNEWRHFVTKNYEWIVDTEKETTVELETITDEDLKGKQYLANIVVNEASANQWVESYLFPKTSLVFWEYTPRLSLVAKEWEHAVLEYDFTVILTEI